MYNLVYVCIHKYAVSVIWIIAFELYETLKHPWEKKVGFHFADSTAWLEINLWFNNADIR